MAVSTRQHPAPPRTAADLTLRTEPDPGTVGHALRPLLVRLLGEDPPVRVELWDGSAFGPADSTDTVAVRSPDALRRMLWAPGELGLARAYVAGDLDIHGEILTMLAALKAVPARADESPLRSLPTLLRAARSVGALGRPLPPPPEEARQRGRRHSKERDAQAISHHYDVGNDFYELVLGSAMTYSCARFGREDMTLAEAQDDSTS